MNALDEARQAFTAKEPHRVSCLEVGTQGKGVASRLVAKQPPQVLQQTSATVGSSTSSDTVAAIEPVCSQVTKLPVQGPAEVCVSVGSCAGTQKTNMIQLSFSSW